MDAASILLRTRSTLGCSLDPGACSLDPYGCSPDQIQLPLQTQAQVQVCGRPARAWRLSARAQQPMASGGLPGSRLMPAPVSAPPSHPLRWRPGGVWFRCGHLCVCVLCVYVCVCGGGQVRLWVQYAHICPNSYVPACWSFWLLMPLPVGAPTCRCPYVSPHRRARSATTYVPPRVPLFFSSFQGRASPPLHRAEGLSCYRDVWCLA